VGRGGGARLRRSLLGILHAGLVQVLGPGGRLVRSVVRRRPPPLLRALQLVGLVDVTVMSSREQNKSFERIRRAPTRELCERRRAAVPLPEPPGGRVVTHMSSFLAHGTRFSHA